MDCIECQMMSSEDVDGELPEEKAAYMMEHLAICQQCKSDYELTLVLRDKLNEDISLTPTINIPADFTSKIIGIIEKEGVRESFKKKLQEPKKPSFFNKFMTKISLRPLSSIPALSFSVAIAIIFTVSLSLYFRQPSQKHSSLRADLTDASKLNTKIVNVKNNNNQTLENDVNFYATRHTEATFGRSIYASNSGFMKRASFSPNR